MSAAMLPPPPTGRTTQAISEAMDRLGDTGLDGDALMWALIEEFPGLLFAEVERTLAVRAFEAEEAEKADAAERAGVVNVLAFMSSRRDPANPNETVGDTARRCAALGDPDAIALLASVDSVERRTGWALIQAAAATHPEWELTDEGNVGFLGEEGGPGDDTDTLVEWFQKNHPLAAREVEARVANERRS